MEESRFSRALKRAFKYYIVVQLFVTLCGFLFAAISDEKVTVSIISMPLFLVVFLFTYLLEID